MACIRAYRGGWGSSVAVAFLVATFLSVLPPSARADQNDPRLDRLFAVLHTSNDARELDLVQGLIWDIWIDHDDKDAARLMQRGIHAMANARNDEALQIFDALIAADPDFAEAWNKRATLHLLMGELDKSRADVERTLELEPRHFGALSGLGQIELLLGEREQALKAFEHALDSNPHLPGARRMIERLRKQNAGFAL
jgi:tetratricopeptide (TPR) repeat protein